MPDENHNDSLRNPGEKHVQFEPDPVVMGHEIPWILEAFYNDNKIDLAKELLARSGTLPVMSNVKFRALGDARAGRGVATLATQDGAAYMVIDADAHSRVIQMAFTFGSMLTLRFVLRDLGYQERMRWLEAIRRQQNDVTFLWGPARWENDYVICISHRYYTNFYAFSPKNFEACVRLTPDVSANLVDWLAGYWEQSEADDENPLLTW